MSNLEDFFEKGGSGLVVEPPSRTTEFPNRALANVLYPATSAAPVDDVIANTEQKGSYLPLGDTSNDVISIRLGDLGINSGLAQQMVRKNILTYNETWAKAPIVASDVPFSCYNYDKTAGKIWAITGSGSQMQVLAEIDAVTGGVTQHPLSAPFISSNDGNKQIATPNLYLLGNGNLGLIFVSAASFTGTNPELSMTEIQKDGTVLSTTKLQIAGNDIIFNGTYISKDKQIVMDGMRRAAANSDYISMNMYRGGSVRSVLTPAPLDRLGYAYSAEDTQETDMFTTKVLRWGDNSVYIVADDSSVDPRVFKRIIGVNGWDVDDFDRWLHEIADNEGMAQGVDLLPGVTLV